MPLTPEQRRQRARIAAQERWATNDGQKAGEAGQAALLERFRQEILAEHPDLTEPEVSRRAEHKRRAHMERLSFLASKAKAAKRAARKEAAS